MPSEVHFSPQFDRDLEEIENYITDKYQDPELADRITDGLIAECEKLRDFPFRGSKVYLPNGMDTGYRFVMYKGYLSFYKTQDAEVYVLRAAHYRQDYLQILIPGLRLNLSSKE